MADQAPAEPTGRVELDYLGLVSATLAGGYLDEWRTMVADEHASRQSVLSALLDGGPPADLSHHPGGPHHVLAFRFGAHPDEATPDVDPGIARRRKLRRLRTELERHRDEPVSMLSADGGIALLSADDDATGFEELASRDEPGRRGRRDDRRHPSANRIVCRRRRRWRASCSR